MYLKNIQAGSYNLPKFEIFALGEDNKIGKILETTNI